MSSCSNRLSLENDVNVSITGDTEKELITSNFIKEASEFDIGFYCKILQSNADVEEEEHAQVEVEEQAQVEVEKHSQFEMQEHDNVDLSKHGHEDDMEDNLVNDMDDYMDYMEIKMEGNIENDQGYRTKFDGEDDSDDSEDNDWVDEDNIIPEVKVDMGDFHMSIDTKAEFFEKRIRDKMEKDGDHDHEELELDVIDNEEWDSVGDESDMGKKRREVIKELGKETRCSLG